MKNLQSRKELIDPLLKRWKFNESKTILRIYECSLDANTIQNLHNEFGSDENYSITIVDELDDLVLESEEVCDNLVIKIQKPTSENLVFFSEPGFKEYLNDEYSLEGIKVVFLGFIERSFQTLSCQFLPFHENPSGRPVVTKISAIDHVKPLTGRSQEFLIKDLSKWLIVDTIEQDIHDVWIEVAAKRLLVCLGREFLLDGDNLQINIAGERRKKIVASLTKSTSREVFLAVTKSVSWIYVNVSDIDSRHTILNYELSKAVGEILDIDSFTSSSRTIDETLDNSKLVYRYHLTNASKELNKLLTDLNKSLFDYISKIRQNTVDLINTLWRDFATAFGVIILNYTIKKNDIQALYFEYFGGALCLYLVISFWLSARSNSWFYKSLLAGLREWRPRIYGYINDYDFEKSTIGPLKQAHSKYMFTFWLVLGLYIISILSVVHFLLRINLLEFFKGVFR
ncbi:MAG: hypothetical protein EON98_00285 [Chitinophagaceae bacterium]|nr:MAG: hypothetical protein EON98_00285 [Chitinophagaceae bacterium]